MAEASEGLAGPKFKSVGRLLIREETLSSMPKVRHFRQLIKYLSVITRDSGLPITNAHNTRSVRLTFHIPNAGVLHGLAGYFEAVLYRDVGLSIHPESQNQISPGMLSWFPLFFPFKV
jgi:hypothetical protein